MEGYKVWSRQHWLEFECPVCGTPIHETIEEVPAYDATADRESDAQGHAEHIATCRGCERQFSIGISNTGGSLVAELADGQTSVRVVGDPVQEPEDLWEEEAYQRANLPADLGQIFKYATYDIDYIRGEVEHSPTGRSQH